VPDMHMVEELESICLAQTMATACGPTINNFSCSGIS